MSVSSFRLPASTHTSVLSRAGIWQREARGTEKCTTRRHEDTEGSAHRCRPTAGICSRENDRCEQHRLSSCLHLPFSRLQTARPDGTARPDCPDLSVSPCLRVVLFSVISVPSAVSASSRLSAGRALSRDACSAASARRCTSWPARCPSQGARIHRASVPSEWRDRWRSAGRRFRAS
jgi:hypothetical protein